MGINLSHRPSSGHPDIPAAPAASDLYRQATHKALFRLIPLLCLAYFMNYVDRTNIGLAKSHLQADVGISVAAFGLGAGLFFVAYALVEVPSNLIMYRVGPRIWIARIAISWGIVTALMMFVSNDVTFYIARFALGAAEAGLYPAILYMVTQWFAQRDRGKIIGYVYIAACLGMLIGSPMSGALMGLQDVGGLHGWQWMFLIEGVFTVLVGFAVLLFVPNRPRDASWLDPDEAQALEDAAGGSGRAHESHSLKGNMKTAFGRPFIIIVGLIYFLNQITINGITVNIPSIVERMNVDSSFIVGVLSGMYGAGALVGVLVVPRIALKMSETRLIAILAAGCAIVAGLFLMTDSPAIQIVLIFILGGLTTGTLPVFWSVVMPRMGGLMAAAGLAFISTIGMSGGFVGPYVFGLVESQSGTPVTGFYVIVVVSIIGAALVAPLNRSLRNEDRNAASGS
ncbi:MAG TPA: MFS transporter [Candidatus Corynebacterium avicola]|uniref:MFS transporter n=1 Tax=Candidatus Corynebacterium avicola TaxID=2838527 RepID=A0A9D1RQW4_9CORY|nr:MFS transporter [Candidatus Corynebacterium avicola]